MFREDRINEILMKLAPIFDTEEEMMVTLVVQLKYHHTLKYLVNSGIIEMRFDHVLRENFIRFSKNMTQEQHDNILMRYLIS